MSHCLSILFAFLALLPASAQTLNLPPRSTNAPGGKQFTSIILNLGVSERENWIYAQVISGNVPDFQRNLKPVSVSIPGHTATFYTAPDYLAIGSNADYFRQPMSPLLAQRLCDRLGMTLPTRKMVNQIWTNSTVKLNPHPYDPNFFDILSLEVFAASDEFIDNQRNAVTNTEPLGALVGGTKKDVIISNEITNRPPPPRVVIYGWHYTNGTFIQSLSAAHENTYADYSHGVRLIQTNLTVNDASSSVASILTSPTLNPLLSDEGLVPQPRYPVPPLAPTVMTHPRSQSAWPGTNLTLSTVVIGDAPLTYHWRLNDTNFVSTTNSILALTNLSAANAGNYSVVVTNAAGSTTSRTAVVRVKTSDFPLLFRDDFNTNSAASWNVFWGAANSTPDYTVDFAYNYGVIPYTFNGVTTLIPPAPNSPDTSARGVKLTVNRDAIATNAAVNLYPKNFSVSGNFALKFDLWINYPGNAGGVGTGVTGSTQHASCGINHLGTNVNWATASAPASDGLWFAATGEGGDSRDYRSYVGNLAGTQTELTSLATSGLIGANHTLAAFQNLFPAPRFETAGAPGKNWVEVELRQTNNIIAWLLDGTVIALRTNTSAFTSGNIMLGLMDVFPSIATPARDSLVLFDNVRVENLAPPIQFTAITRQPNGHVALSLRSAIGDNFWLETSTNLTAWQPLANLLATNQPLQFTDTTSSIHALRYYRARR